MPSDVCFISFINLAGTGTLTATTAAAGYPVTNLTSTNHYLPWRSTVTTDTSITLNMGTATAFDRIGILNTNFTTVQFRQGSSSPPGSFTYSSGNLTVERDPDHRIYRRQFGPATFRTTPRQYTHIYIPAQATITGEAFFSIGALWVGTFVPLAKTPRIRYGRGIIAPTLRETANLGKWSVEYKSGDPFAVQKYLRHAQMNANALTPGQSDEWADWMAHDRDIEFYRRFCWLVDGWGSVAGTSAVWVMRQTNQVAWTIDYPIAEDTWDLEEVIV